MVGHLDNPRAGRTFGAIKRRALLMDEEEYILEQVVRFRIVPEDLVPDRPHLAGITAKEATQRLLISFDGASHQDFIWDIEAGCRASIRD